MVFSAMGSFFIPMAVMVYVYVRISCVVAARHDHMTEIEVHKVNFTNKQINKFNATHTPGKQKRKVKVKTKKRTSIAYTIHINNVDYVELMMLNLFSFSVYAAAQ